jgi:hypothetical protein
VYNIPDTIQNVLVIVVVVDNVFVVTVFDR